MLESSGFRKYSTPVVFQLFYRRLCLCLCICIFVWIWMADVMSLQEINGLRGPWGPTAVLQLTYELRPTVPKRTPRTTTIARLPLPGRTLGRGSTKIVLNMAGRFISPLELNLHVSPLTSQLNTKLFSSYQSVNIFDIREEKRCDGSLLLYYNPFSLFTILI